MKKQEYIDLGIAAWLSSSQIEAVLCKILWVSRSTLFQCTEISSKHIYEVQKCFFDIKNGAPEEYTLQTANFYGRDLYVDNRVLIPRNDTEVLVRTSIQYINSQLQPQDWVYIDVGTGSACIPVSIIEEIYPLRFREVYALDISQEALMVAEKNIEKFAPGKIKTLQSNLLQSFAAWTQIANKNIFITANLPYIKNGDYENMDASVISHEPDSALYGGEKTWFELYEKLIKQCFGLKKILSLQEILLVIEIGFDQKEISRDFLRELWLKFEYFTDSANIDRVIVISGF